VPVVMGDGLAAGELVRPSLLNGGAGALRW
jgi:hypothetical protein